MSLRTFARVAGVCVILLSFAGCGDYFRPVANPVSKPGGDPAVQRTAVIISNNNGGIGGSTDIDISGDTVMATHILGLNPVYAASFSGFINYVANAGDDTLSSYNANSPGSEPAIVNLPRGSRPTFVTIANGQVLVANTGGNTVTVVEPGQNVISHTIPVGVNPVSIAALPNFNKLYVTNQGDNTVSVIDTLDFTVVATIPVGTKPVASAVNPDGGLVFVVDQGSGDVTAIDTSVDKVSQTFHLGGAPNSVFYDNKLRRMYVTNPGNNTVAVFKADVVPPVQLATVTVGTAPVAVAALADGTRVYVANSGSNTVSVITTTNNTVLKTIPVGTAPVAIAASGDSIRVIVANRDSDNISSIRTTDDTVIATIKSVTPKPVFVTIDPS
jgi:YVTN family beta-propeller protein